MAKDRARMALCTAGGHQTVASLALRAGLGSNSVCISSTSSNCSVQNVQPRSSMLQLLLPPLQAIRGQILVRFLRKLHDRLDLRARLDQDFCHLQLLHLRGREQGRPAEVHGLLYVRLSLDHDVHQLRVALVRSNVQGTPATGHAEAHVDPLLAEQLRQALVRGLHRHVQGRAAVV
eukprot:CAMPEP_0197941458 /NCGR_PEP_ID=MMETSP1439-20131203/122824_1 /TAXON_ID=66791 /ORGANISM="Gonyaulax spinifera, Strain CCMP409" /LENGTH=175 /DNA_ID=CAMNT_0043564657 /DNA_START=15 /DNA_END=539 /DNA_ORIENTATION=+